jgi:hypothetical protein
MGQPGHKYIYPSEDRSSSKQYLEIQFLHWRKHNASVLQGSIS